MENNNKKGWAGKQINRALPHLCQNGVSSSTDKQRWAETTLSLLSFGCVGFRASLPGAGMGTRWRCSGQLGLFTALWELPALQIRLLMMKPSIRLPHLFACRAGGELRAATCLLTEAGNFQDASLEIQTSYPKSHRTHISALQWSKVGGETKRRGQDLLENSWFNGFFCSHREQWWRCFPKDNSEHQHQNTESV